MAMARESTFLPTIKCSSCGNEVQISMMGEHICAGADDSESSPQLDPINEFPAPPIPEKADRLPRPVNVGAASKIHAPTPMRTISILTEADQLYSPAQLTPLSPYGGSEVLSPLTPGLSPQPRPLFSNAEDQARPDSAMSNSSSMRRPGGYGGFGDQLSPEPSVDGSLRSPSQASFMHRADSMTPAPLNAGRRPSTASQNAPMRLNSYNSQDERPTTSSGSVAGDMSVPSHQARQGGYGGFSAHGSDNMSASVGSLNRAETFPKPSIPNEPPMRTSSTPGTRSQHTRKPSENAKPPPRKSLIRPAHTNSIDLAAEFGTSNPYHTPSDSASSGYSTFSNQPSYTSAQTSPARSQNRLRPSDRDSQDQIPRRLDNFRPKDINIEPLHSAQQQRPLRTPSPLIESPFEMSPHRDAPASRSSAETKTAQAMLSASPQEDPMSFGGRLQRTDTAPAWIGASPPRNGVAPPQRKGSAIPNRGDCKACRLPITGKSISSADGRLTGKYHKACFVCSTCSEPFASAEFYVLNDKPYCEQHYHKLNHSLCGSCSLGIEGQYLEDETSLKYHVGCFRCLDCGHSLSDGYYEVDGGSYCEKDAMVRVQRAWDTQHMHSPPMEQGRFPPRGSSNTPPRGGAPGPPRGAPGPRGAPRGGPGGSGPGPRPRGPVGLPSHPGPVRGSSRGGRGGPMPPPSSRGGFPGMPRPAFAGGPTLNKRSTRLGMM